MTQVNIVFLGLRLVLIMSGLIYKALYIYIGREVKIITQQESCYNFNFVLQSWFNFLYFCPIVKILGSMAVTFGFLLS